MKSVEFITALYESRRTAPEQRWRAEAQLVKQLMTGDLWTPVTERIESEEGREYAVTANNALMNLEQMVKRIVSTQPNVKFVPVRAGSKPSQDKARLRRLAALAFWDMNEVGMKDRKRVRWLQGYGVGPVQITAHPTLPIPKWTLRDPLMTYPAVADEDTGFIPNDCIFAYKRTFAWLNVNYPLAAFDLKRTLTSAKRECHPDTTFDIVEYLDAEERVLVLWKKDAAPQNRFPDTNAVNDVMVELDRMDNRIGVCPMVIPSLIGIDRVKSQYVANAGMSIMRNKLAALEYIFAERSVFADTYFVEPPGSPNGDIVELADGPSGKIGWLRGGSLEQVGMQPNFAGTQMIDRLEREERISNSSPAEFGGESASNIRTAVRGDRIAGAAVDFTIQETQDILSLAKEHELKLAIKVDKAYYNKDKSFYVGWDKAKNEKIDYKPENIWENDQLHVIYSASGVDVNSQVISGGQRIAQGTMSKRTFMEMDPMVEDAEFESDSIIAEQLDASILSDLLQPGGMLDPVAKAEVAELVRSNKMDLSAAVMEVQRKRQEAQATQDEEGNPTGVDPNSPAAQPGLAPEAAAGIAGPNASQGNLSTLLSSLRRPSEQATASGA